MVPPLAAHVRRFLLTSECLFCTGHPSALREMIEHTEGVDIG